MASILIISQHYYPENFRITDIAESLVKKGHSITVLCGYPNYPSGEILPDYKGKNKSKHKNEKVNGVNIIRCFEYPRKKGSINLFLNYYSIFLSMLLKAKKIKERYDLVLINQLSPVMQAWAGISYAKKHKIPTLLYCYDLWPESLAAGGIKKDSIIYRYYYKVSNKIYNNVDNIAVTSKGFLEYFIKTHKIKKEKLIYLPQYCEEIFKNVEYIKKENEFNYVFAGNVGKMQSVETIVKAANIIKSDKTIKIHIIGSGSDLEKNIEMAKQYGLDNVIFYGQKPLEDMPKYYSIADAMIVTLSKNEIISKTLPGKVQSYMCSGKPIIASADGEIQTILEDAKCGLYCNAMDYEGLAKLFIEFKKLDYNELSVNSLNYYIENFSKQIFLKRLEEKMEEILK